VTARNEFLATLGIPSDLPLLLYSGILAPDSGAAALLNAHAALAARGREAALVLSGDGPQRAELESQAHRQGLECVYFTGELPEAQRAELLAAADIALAPTATPESYYLAREALACGTPVIAARGGALDEVVDERVGCLVDPNDHELLADALQRALDEDWRASKAKAARESVASSRGSVAQHVAMYEAVLAQRYGSQPPP
jgi:glycosyltransferase involved in cell wall biosynthesis